MAPLGSSCFLEIYRFTERSDLPTLGVLLINTIPNFVTLELPWKDNERNVSCIPEGGYMCEKIVSPKFGETLHVQNVPDRSEIIFHSGNSKEDTRGCILVGTSFTGLPKIVDSRVAMRKLMARVRKYDTIHLRIRNL